MRKGDVKKTTAWIESWKEIGPRLEHLRRQELRKISTARSLQNLSGAFESCRLHFKPKLHLRIGGATGLV
ncbi:MAG: hypothetical protein HY879_21620 [Deltaproteobacteria bacterium]|nr:hypothetical protein [Deltaproteobacteria bacterium]